MIPKIFHLIWLGPAPIHPRMLAWHRGWCELHPDWKMKLWRSEKSGFLRWENEIIESRLPNLLDQALHYSQQTNIWRLEVLLAQGGIYMDTDVECLKNIEPLIAPHEAFIAQMYLIDRCSSAFLGARPDDPWIGESVRRLPLRDPKAQFSMGDAHVSETAALFPHVKVLGREEALICNADERIRIMHPPTAKTYLIHHNAGRWYPTAYQKL